MNFFIKHLLVDADGQFAGATQWICQMQDPVIVVHCVLDTWWQRAKTRGFLFGTSHWLSVCVCVLLKSGDIDGSGVDQCDIWSIPAEQSLAFVYTAGVPHEPVDLKDLARRG